MEGANSNWRPGQGDASGMNMDPAASGDWRQQLQPEARQRIVNKIMDTLQRCLPIYGQEGLGELRKIAQRFEEKTYTAATNQSDYLRKISLKMLTMEKETQNSGVANQMPSNPSNQNLPDPELIRFVEAQIQALWI
uniref:Mediator of RNA polymerase II transcription subunit 15 n=1 Tax=Anthurium amnicola TaxID=1678845 RepID=A0A1D1XMC6_9ARAE